MSGPHRVVFVVPNPDLMGGTERATFHLTGELQRTATIEPFVLGIHRDRDTPYFVEDLVVPCRYLVDLRQSGADGPAAPDPAADGEHGFTPNVEQLMRRALADLDAHVVVATTPQVFALVAKVAPPRAVLVVAEHRATSARGASLAPLLRRAGDADAVVVLAERGRERLASVLGAQAPRIEAIPNIVPDLLVPRSTCLEPQVLAAGRFVESKQFDHAIAAFARAWVRPWRLRIIGEGPVRRSLERQIAALGAHDAVEIVEPLPSIPHELAKSSLLLITSQVEGLPLTALEALAAGVPIVSYDIPLAIGDVVVDGVNGRLVAPNDVDELTAAIGELIGDPIARQTMGEHARAHARQFAPDRVVPRWCALIADLVAAGPRRGRAEDSARPPSRTAARPADDTGWVPRGGLLLHVGPHKTGTTALQSALLANRRRLLEHGVWYGPRPAWHGAVMARLGTMRGWDDAIPPASRRAWRQLCVLTRSVAETVVVSSEAFCHAGKADAAVLTGELRPGPARVVITLRPLERVIPSSWQEYVKSGWTTTLDEFLHYVFDAPDDPDNPTPTFWQRQDHGALVERWATALGAANVAVVVSNPRRAHQLFDALTMLLGLPEGVLTPAGPSNRSLSFAETEFLRMLNVELRSHVAWTDYNQLLRLGGVASLVEGRPTTGAVPVQLPPEAVARARDIGRDAMERIEASGVMIVGELSDLVPSDAMPEGAAVPVGTVDEVAIDAVLQIVEGIVDAQQRRTAQLPAWDQART